MSSLYLVIESFTVLAFHVVANLYWKRGAPLSFPSLWTTLSCCFTLQLLFAGGLPCSSPSPSPSLLISDSKREWKQLTPSLWILLTCLRWVNELLQGGRRRRWRCAHGYTIPVKVSTETSTKMYPCRNMNCSVDMTLWLKTVVAQLLWECAVSQIQNTNWCYSRTHPAPCLEVRGRQNCGTAWRALETLDHMILDCQWYDCI